MDSLLSMGFDSESAQVALRNNNYDLEAAINSLIGNPLPSSDPETAHNLASRANISSRELKYGDESGFRQLDLSQYSFEGGVSACTSLALSAGLTILKLIEVEHIPTHIIIQCQDQIQESFFKGLSYHATASASTMHGNASHLSVEDICQRNAEILDFVHPVSSYPVQGAFISANDHFEKFLIEIFTLGEPNKHTALIFTKPPETLCIILPPAEQQQNGFLLFDSHSRPQLGFENAYIGYFRTKEELIEHLRDLYPYFPTDEDVGWMASMYEQFEGTPFQANL